MAIKKEIEVDVKYSVDNKGIDEARKQIESLKNAGNSSSGGKATADEQSKAAEKEVQAEERRQKKAKEAADAIEQARRREKAALEELVAELEQYQAVLQKATQLENHPDRLKALKNIQELERRIAALTKAQERQAQSAEKVAQSSKQLDRNSQQATRSVKNMGQGMLQVAYFMDDVQYGIKGILNNIPGLVMGFGGGAGLAGAVSIAVLAGAKLYEWMGNTEAKSKELAKAIEQQNEAIKESQEIVASFNNEAALKTSNDLTAKIAGNRKEEAQALKESVREQQRLLDLQSKILDNQDQADLLKLETDYYSGAFGDPESFSARLFFEGKQEDIRLRARARHRQEQEESARINVSNAERDLASKTEATNRNSERLGGLQDQNILSYQEREKLNGEILNAEKQIFDNLLSIAKTARNNEEQEGFLGIGRISSNDMREWIKQLIENGGDTSALENTSLQNINIARLPNFRSAQQLMEDVLTAGNGRVQLDRLNALRKQRTDSDNALVDAGYDVSTDDALSEAYKNRDKAVEQAQESLKKAIEDQTEAEKSLTTSTQQLEEVRKINASEEKIDEAQRERNEAVEQQKRIVQAQKENENAIKDQIRERENEVRELKKEISRLKERTKNQRDKRDNIIENVNLAGFSKSLTDALSSPDRDVSGRARERKSNINEAYSAIIRYIKDAFKDNRVTENEMEVLSKKLMQELSSRGENKITYAQTLDLVKRIIALVEKGSSDGNQYRAAIKSMEARVQRLEKESQAQKTGLNMVAGWFVS